MPERPAPPIPARPRATWPLVTLLLCLGLLPAPTPAQAPAAGKTLAIDKGARARRNSPAPSAAKLASGRVSNTGLRGLTPIAKLAVLVSVDGLRADAVYPYAPTMHRLGREGASAIHARTISEASTLPSHASMVSGVDVDQHGLSFNSYRPDRGHIRYPTIFSEAKRAGLATALFVGKRKLAHLLDPTMPAHFAVGGVRCEQVTKLAIPYLETARPGVVFVHFSDPDSAGHRHGWMSDPYLKAVRRADRCVRGILAALETRGRMQETLLLVTSDHGGHNRGHNSHHDTDRDTPWIAYGAGVKQRARVGGTVYNVDTAATIFHALGLVPPKAIAGQPILTAFR